MPSHDSRSRGSAHLGRRSRVNCYRPRVVMSARGDRCMSTVDAVREATRSTRDGVCASPWTSRHGTLARSWRARIGRGRRVEGDERRRRIRDQVETQSIVDQRSKREAQGGFDMKRIIGFASVAVLILTLTAALAEEKVPDGSIKLSGGSVAVGVGYSWASGTLTYKGKDYPISVSGLSVGDVGATKVEAA